MEATARARSQATDEAGSSTRTLSHGRGGAGNMGIDRRASGSLADLATPTIKADKYTTGRGGSGNMASNNPRAPEVARAAQDVASPVPRQPESSFHVGRGGVANIVTLSEAEAKAAREANKETVGTKSGGVKDILEKVGLKK